jgi:hypothetical protein
MAPAQGFHRHRLPRVEQRERHQTRRRAPWAALDRRTEVSSQSAHTQPGGSNSSKLGVIVSTLENRFFFDIYKTLEADAHAKGLRSRNDEHGLSR